MLAKVRSPEMVERNTDWVVAIWSTIEPKLRQVMGVARLLVAPTHPHHHLSGHHSPKARLLATRLGAEAGEEELEDFWDYVTDLRVSTDFWRSARAEEAGVNIQHFRLINHIGFFKLCSRSAVLFTSGTGIGGFIYLWYRYAGKLSSSLPLPCLPGTPRLSSVDPCPL